jgi:hypothetical protein
MTTFNAGDRVVWYDSRLWGPRDIGHNEHCRKPGTIVRAYTGRDGRPAVDILFDHNPLVSHGHFAYGLYEGTIIQEELSKEKT